MSANETTTDDEQTGEQDLIRVPRAEWERLKARVRSLESRLEEASAPSSGRFDRYDLAVLDVLEDGMIYRTDQVVETYQRHSAIQQQKTAKKRAKRLVESECFSGVGWNRHRFHEPDDLH